MELLQNGPVATWFDVGEDFRFYGGAGGVYYNTEVCGNNGDEAVPPECTREGGGYTCLGDCKRKLPQHCDRCVIIFVICIVYDYFYFVFKDFSTFHDSLQINSLGTLLLWWAMALTG